MLSIVIFQLYILQFCADDFCTFLFMLWPELNSAGKIPYMIFKKLADVCFLQLYRVDFGNSYILYAVF